MKKIFYFTITILLVVLITISSYFIYKQKSEEKQQDNLYEEIADSISEDNESKRIDLTDLYNQNNDLVGWIKIENTNIDYPIMQTKNNPDYYLRKNFYKAYSYYGTPFMEEECDVNTSENLIIYGHHMQNSKMFGSLENYKNYDFYKAHKYIKFCTLKDYREYEIFAVFKTTLYKSNTFKYYQNIELDSEIEYFDFINKCIDRSFYNTNVTPNYKEKLLTLSTCEYSENNSRLVVIAKLIDMEYIE